MKYEYSLKLLRIVETEETTDPDSLVIEEVTFTGDVAKDVYIQLKGYINGTRDINGIIYSDDDGTQHLIEMECICGYERSPMTATEGPEKSCKQINCFDCRGCEDGEEEGA